MFFHRRMTAPSLNVCNNSPDVYINEHSNKKNNNLKMFSLNMAAWKIIDKNVLCLWWFKLSEIQSSEKIK